MLLTGDRLDVQEGERLRAVMLVTAPQVVVASKGGTSHLRHEVEDVGFRDVLVAPELPSGWRRGGDVRKPTGLDWLVWVAATPTRSASLSRELTEELAVLDAWAAEADSPQRASLAHPYAVLCFRAGRVFGVVRVYGFAYPALGKEGSC